MLRVFFFSIAGIPLILLDGLLLYGFPALASASYTREEGYLVIGGAALYIVFHFVIRKPERMYLWGHEFSHLVAAKLFLRKVHSFHITSRDGGKVVIDRTNVMIDLAPYIFPLYLMAAGCAAVLFRTASPWVQDVYLVIASFLFSMHLLFSAEGFIKGQPDVKRSGRLFSGAVVLLCLLMWIPCVLAPGTTAGWKGAAGIYSEWLRGAWQDALRLFNLARSQF